MFLFGCLEFVFMNEKPGALIFFSCFTFKQKEQEADIHICDVVMYMFRTGIYIFVK